MLRRTPLKRTARLAAKTWIKRGTSILGKRSSYTGPKKPAKDLLGERSGGVCEKCGQRPAQDPHHRNGRRAGGTSDEAINNLSNLLALCRPCHIWVTENPLWAVGRGWSVLSWQDPAAVPVRLWHGTYLLDDEGGMLPHNTRTTT